jgi:predicted Zn finger-like uncharacterized protein
LRVDVRCERCGREYVFDDDQLTDVGVLVRCTRCDHTFRIRREGPVSAAPHPAPPAEVARASDGGIMDPAAKSWLIRQPAGNVISFESLSTLRHWIASGKVGRDDEISRSGSLWRKLGAVPEFQGLFVPQAASAHAPALPFQSTRDLGDAGDAAPIVAAPGEAPLPPPRTDSGGFDIGVPFAPVVERAPAWVDTDPKSASRTEPDLQARSSLALAETAPPSPKPSAPPTDAWSDAGASGIGEGAAFAGMGDEDDDVPIARWQRRRKRRIIVGVSIAIVVLAAGGLFLFNRPLFLRILGLAGGDAAPSQPVPAPTGTTAPSAPTPSGSAVAPASASPSPPSAPSLSPTSAVGASPALGPSPAAPAATGAPTAPPKPSAPTALAPPVMPQKRVDEGAASKPKRRTVAQTLAAARRLRKQNPKAALRLYAEALARGGGASAHAGKGWTYLELAEYSLAARSFQAAIQRGQGRDSYIGLGTAYKRLNQRARARAQFKRYLELYPDGDDAPVARTNLDALAD